MSALEDADLRSAHATLRQGRPAADALHGQLREAARLLSLAPALPDEPALVFLRPNATSAEVRAIGAGVVVGRGEDCEVCFAGRRELSRRHFAVRREADEFFVEDLVSSNGTRIKGHAAAIQRRVLRDGDLIDAGDFVFLFVRPE